MLYLLVLVNVATILSLFLIVSLIVAGSTLLAKALFEIPYSNNFIILNFIDKSIFLNIISHYYIFNFINYSDYYSILFILRYYFTIMFIHYHYKIAEFLSNFKDFRSFAIAINFIQ